MALHRVLAALLLLATLVIPATAEAKAKASTKVPVEVGAASAAAQRYWGAVPCNGQVKVSLQRPVAAGVDPAADAWASFSTPLGANNLAAPASGYTKCTISFGRGRWPTSASLREDWDMFCATMIHESGHLLGRAHDDTPGSVMTPMFTDVASIPSICRATRPGRSAASARSGR